MGAAGFGGSFAPLCGVALKFLIEYQYVLIGFSQQSDKLEFVRQPHLPLPLGEVPPQGAERALSVTAYAVTA